MIKEFLSQTGFKSVISKGFNTILYKNGFVYATEKINIHREECFKLQSTRLLVGLLKECKLDVVYKNGVLTSLGYIEQNTLKELELAVKKTLGKDNIDFTLKANVLTVSEATSEVSKNEVSELIGVLKCMNVYMFKSDSGIRIKEKKASVLIGNESLEFNFLQG